MNRINDIWDEFLINWRIQYTNAKCILKYLNSYPEVIKVINLEKVVDLEALDNVQKEWIQLCSKFDNPIESEFFKTFWIPIQVNSYDYFIDISDDNFPIFEIHFFFFEPFRWYKKFLINDIRDLLLVPDTRIDIKKILDKNEKIRWDQVDKFFLERKRLTGKVKKRF